MMSKRKSTGSSNTLFNYFTKTPPSSKSSKKNDYEAGNGSSVGLAVEEENKNKKRERQLSTSPDVNKHKSDSEEEILIAPVKKRKRIRIDPVDSDDSDTENKADNKVVSKPKQRISIEKRLNDSFKYETNQSPNSSKQAKSKPANETTPAKEKPSEEKAAISDEGNWIHCKLDWLKPEKIRDAMRRRPDHPDYDPTTLYVPTEFFNSQTPAHRQWWEMKSQHYDCVLFFKVGKFYELYHMDAAVGVNELGFSYMKTDRNISLSLWHITGKSSRLLLHFPSLGEQNAILITGFAQQNVPVRAAEGEFAHSGFPESAYARMASTLISKGYKVARVEQTETPDMMQERCRLKGQMSKWDKVVRREICQVTVRGTQVCGLQDPGPGEATANYMMAVAEEEQNGCSTYGVCFVDTSIGLFHLGQFTDDKHSSRLLTTLAHFPPALVIYDRKTTTPRTNKLISTHCHGARREPGSLWTPEKTLKTLAEKYYKTNADGEWPEGLEEYLHEGDTLGLTPAPHSHLAIRALSGCVSYLTACLLDIQILGMGQFTSYAPPDVLNKTLSQEVKVENRWDGGNMMVLDAITLKNLRIVQDEGCLYDRLNFCSTAFGKRLLYQWVCAPSCNVNVIKERQEAVRTLFENQELCQDAKNILTTLPDLERLLAKVHALGNLKRSEQHPDARAIFYEEKTYSKRKVLDFISVLNGFTAALKLVKLFSAADAKLLKKIMQLPPYGKYPDYRDTLKFFKEAFNQKEAEKEGRILPGEGVDKEYDNTLETIQEIEQELKEYLAEQERYFKARCNYVGTDKKRYQIEVPQGPATKAGPEYSLEGARKGYKRFSTAETKDLLSRMQAAEELKSKVLKDLSRRIFERFSSKYSQWEAAVQCLATIDILLAFTEFARQQSGDVCLPEVTFDGDSKPYIKIVEGRHPCIVNNDFIPNDTKLGGDTGTLLLLTGPNMGGKSTLMRQVGLLSVLAHLGSYVPAAECSLSLTDRVFTRLGASDDILSGQSTFLVEMNETAAIIAHAGLHSLVLLDELGRGTSTYDGTAIASGVAVELCERGCRVIFSTHYHSLVGHLSSHAAVVLGHMACMVETDESTAETEDQIPEETITFLYKLSPGACPKSYGFNAARLAGIPKKITRRAHQVSRNLEKEATCVRAFKDLMNVKDASRVREMLAALSI